MQSKKRSRTAAGVMLLFAAGFFLFAVTHPTASFPWSNAVTYTVYVLYALVMIILFIAPQKKNEREHEKADRK